MTINIAYRANPLIIVLLQETISLIKRVVSP